MAPHGWTTETQELFLQSLLPEYMEINSGTKLYTDFWAKLRQNWFQEYPENAILFPGKEVNQLNAEECNQVTEAMKKTMSRLMSWYRWRANPAANTGRRARQKPSFSKKDSRQPKNYELYSKMYYAERILPQVQKELGDMKHLTRKERLPIITRITREKFEKETDEVKAEVEAKLEEMKLGSDDSDDDNKLASKYERTINEIPGYLGRVLSDLSEASGWSFSVLMGGPCSKSKGKIVVASLHEGTNTLSCDFGQAYSKFHEHCLVPYTQFLESVYPEHIREARALKAPSPSRPNSGMVSEGSSASQISNTLVGDDFAPSTNRNASDDEFQGASSLPTWVISNASATLVDDDVSPSTNRNASDDEFGASSVPTRVFSNASPSPDTGAPSINRIATADETNRSNAVSTPASEITPIPASEISPDSGSMTLSGNPNATLLASLIEPEIGGNMNTTFPQQDFWFPRINAVSTQITPIPAGEISLNSGSTTLSGNPNATPLASLVEPEIGANMNPVTFTQQGFWFPNTTDSNLEMFNVKQGATAWDFSHNVDFSGSAINGPGSCDPLTWLGNPALSNQWSLSQITEDPVLWPMDGLNPATPSFASSLAPFTPDNVFPSNLHFDNTPLESSSTQSLAGPGMESEISSISADLYVPPPLTTDIVTPNTNDSLADPSHQASSPNLVTRDDADENTRKQVPKKGKLRACGILKEAGTNLSNCLKDIGPQSVALGASDALSSATETRRSTRPVIPSKRSDQMNLIGSKTTTVAPVEKENLPPKSPPTWAVAAQDYLLGVELGMEWRACVKYWMELESVLGYGTISGSKATLPAVSLRPEEWSKWVTKTRGGERPYHEFPTIKDAAEFGVAFVKWWNAIQPPFRRSPEGMPQALYSPSTTDAWSPLQRAGLNGLVSVVTLLFWWGRSLRNQSEWQVDSNASWKGVVNDVTHTLQALKVASISRKKRKAPFSDSKNPDKRPRL